MGLPVLKLVVSGVLGLGTLIAIWKRNEIKKKLIALGAWIRSFLGKEKIEVQGTSRSTSVSTFDEQEELEAMLCPISQEVMKDPVMTPSGHCFDRRSIEDWLGRKNYCPITREELSIQDLKPCHTLKKAIREYRELLESLKKNQ